jgi:hypothetical protein
MAIINQMLANATRGQPEPEVGMGATTFSGSDRYPATIYEVIQAKQGLVVGIADDDYKVVSGSVMDGVTKARCLNRTT